MHQNLKFNLDPSVTGEWQPIVASQVYGTFYMIYIQFIDSKAPATKNHNYEYHCMFKIQNFRGAISIGFGDKPKLALVDPKDVNSKDPVHYYFDLEVAPFSKHWDTKIIKLESVYDLTMPDKIFEGRVEVLPPPSFMYNSESPEESLYLHPDEFKRDGDSYLKIKFREHGTSEVTQKRPTGDGYGKYPGLCDMTRSITR